MPGILLPDCQVLYFFRHLLRRLLRSLSFISPHTSCHPGAYRSSSSTARSAAPFISSSRIRGNVSISSFFVSIRSSSCTCSTSLELQSFFFHSFINMVHGNLDDICRSSLDRGVHGHTFSKRTLHEITGFQFRHRAFVCPNIVVT